MIRFIKPGTWTWALIHKHAFKVQRKWNTPMYWFHIEPNRRINLVWWLVFIFRTHTLSQQTQVRTHINNNTHDNELDTHSTNKHQSLLPRDETLKQYEWANMIHYTNTTLNSCFGYQFIRATIRTCMCVLLFFYLIVYLPHSCGAWYGYGFEFVLVVLTGSVRAADQCTNYKTHQLQCDNALNQLIFSVQLFHNKKAYWKGVFILSKYIRQQM